MSHYCQIETEIRDVNALVQALEALQPSWSGEIWVGKPIHLTGYQGDVRPEMAEVVIPRQSIGRSSNDIGFVRDPETGKFRAIISEFDSRVFNEEWLGRLKQKYARNVVLQEAKRSGMDITSEETREDGSIKILLEVD